ncbi:FUSC family protein [Microcella sp.]|uniref:FUSC family protein n=1 Tax=Microcella sp. TaxID=1913979 RepID=UPI003F71CAAD
MTITAPRLDPRLSRTSIISALVLVASVSAILGLTAVAIGPNTAQAAFLSIMLLLSPVRAAQSSTRGAAALLAVLVAIGGFLLGPLGLNAVLAGVVLVSIAQAFFRLGDVATMTRAPVNLLAFAGLATTGAELWQVVLGTVVGAAFTLVLARLLPPSETPPTVGSLRDRLDDGIALAIGAVLIVVLAEWADFPFAGWALLSLCMIVTVGGDARTARSVERVVGTILGAVLATLVSFTPAPWPLVVALLCGVLAVAYLRQGTYAMFAMFLTPAVLLTSTTDLTAVQLGIGRIEAVLAAAVIAMAVTTIVRALQRRRSAAARDDARGDGL